MEEASGADRSRASAIVEAAFKSGRIIAADRDLRLGQLKSAQTRQDVDLVVRDLPGGSAAGPAHTMPPPMPAPTVAARSESSPPPYAGSPAPGQRPWPLVDYGPPPLDSAEPVQVSGAAKTAGGVIALAVVLTVAITVVGVAVAIFSASQDFTEGPFAEPINEQTYSPGVAPEVDGVNIFTPEGYADMVAAVEGMSGSAEVFQAVIYPRYAVLSVPVGPKGRRYESFRWDGRSLTSTSVRSTSDDRRIDLVDVDLETVLELMDYNLDRVDDPNLWYAVIGSFAKDARISVYASNEFEEGAYVVADLNGDIEFESDY